MVPSTNPLKAAQARGRAPGEGEGRYLYCVAEGASEAILGRIGLDGRRVYAVPHEDISAIVHRCRPMPYQSEDGRRVKGWVTAHQRVVEAAWKSFGTVAPASFNTIIAGENGKVREWLREDYVMLKEKLKEVRGKAEYGVQVLWDPEAVRRRVVEGSETIKRLREESKGKPRGTAYLYKQRIEREIKGELERLAEGYFRDFYERIKGRVDRVHVEGARKVGEKVTLMNLSVLIGQEKVKPLGEELERIKEVEGFEVRFSGPWPPYSFV